MAKTSTNTKIAVGTGLAALAAAAAGAYFLYGSKDGAKKRKQIKSWGLKLKADVLEKLENLEDVSEDTYMKIVDEATKGYKAVKNVDAAELAQVAMELKKHWKSIKRDITPKKVISAAKKTVKKVAAKVPTKKTK